MKFLPDAPRDTPDILTEVEAIPTVRGYAGSPTVISSGYGALAAACNGAALVYKLDGNIRVFAGTQSKLYEGSGGVWTDRSRGGSYTTGDTRWCFAQYGNTTYAINKATVLQASTGAAFADVANAPKAKVIFPVGQFMMALNTDDSGLAIAGGPNADNPDRWWCSQIFAPQSTWAPAASTQATTGQIVDTPGGFVAGKALGQLAIGYKSRAIHIGTYSGPPDVWTWRAMPGEIGTWSQEAVISIGSAHLFIGYENIYRIDGSGGIPVPIGDGMREWFFARLNKSYGYLIAGMHDRNSSTVWWWYPSGSSTVLDSILVYNYASDRWGHLTDRTALEPIPSTIPVTPPETDPLIGNVKLLLHFNGADLSTTFTDSSASPLTFTATADAKLTTTSPIMGTASLALDGTLDEITAPAMAAKLQLGTGDFCIEGWANLTTLGSIRMLVLLGSTAGNNAVGVRFNASNRLELLEIGGAGFDLGLPAISVATNTHWAVYRISGQVYGALGGVVLANHYARSTNYCLSAAEPVEIGCYSGSWAFVGKLDDIRITVGNARYGATNFTPPSTQFPDV